jgi:predicted phage tail component-like protein
MSTYGFTFNGIHSSTYGIRILDVRRPILAPRSVSLRETAGREGKHFLSVKGQEFKIEVDILLYENSKAALRDKVQTIATWLKEDELKSLKFDDEPEREFLVVLSEETRLEEILGIGKATLIFLSPYPYGFLQEKTVSSQAELFFERDSNAVDFEGNEVNPNVPRYNAFSGDTGVLVENSTTNYLSENQADVELGTDGFSAYNGATISQDATTAWHGSNSLKIVTPGSVDREGVETDYVSISASENTPVLASAYVKGASGGEIVRLEIEIFDENYNSLGSSGSNAVSMSTSWYRLYAPVWVPTGSTAAYAKIRVVTKMFAPQAVTFYVDALQLELNRVEPSTWFYSGTRNAESLVGNFFPFPENTGTIEFMFYPPWMIDYTQEFFSIGSGSGIDVSGNPNPSAVGLYIGRRQSNATLRVFEGNGSNYCYLSGGSINWSDINYFAYTYSSAARKLYLNGSFVASASYGESFPTGYGFQFGNPAISAYPNAWLLSFRVSNVMRSDAEISSAWSAKSLSADSNTVIHYGFENQLKPTGAYTPTIQPGGIYSIPPRVRIWIPSGTPAVGLVMERNNEKKTLVIGESYDTTSPPASGWQLVFAKKLTTLVGWTQAVEINNEGWSKSGWIKVDGDGFHPGSYGTPATGKYHGPAMKTSFPELVSDFRLSVSCRFFSSIPRIGRFVVLLLDSTNAVVGLMEIRDAWAHGPDMVFSARMGDSSTGIRINWDTVGVHDFNGELSLERFGNVWTFKVVRDDGIVLVEKSKEDTNNSFTQAVAQIVLAFGAYQNYTIIPWSHMIAKNFRLEGYKSGAPVPFQEGDIVEINFEDGNVMLNDFPKPSILSIDSDYFELLPGVSHTFSIQPETAYQIIYRERY